MQRLSEERCDRNTVILWDFCRQNEQHNTRSFRTHRAQRIFFAKTAGFFKIFQDFIAKTTRKFWRSTQFEFRGTGQLNTVNKQPFWDHLGKGTLSFSIVVFLANSCLDSSM